jgi:hypothetical protein
MATKKLRPAFVFVACLFAALLFGCNSVPNVLVPGKPVVSIGSPPHGASVNLGQEVLVQASAVDASGVSRVELWVDGALDAVSQPPSPQTSHAAVLRWTPTVAGPHMLMVKAINTSGITSDPAAITVNVVALNSPTPTPIPTTVPIVPLPASPTSTPVTPAPTSAPPTQTLSTPTACVSDAAFVEHVTVPDGTNWMPGQAFNKIWRVRNAGTCAWGPGYELVFVGGEAMTTQASFIVPVTAPGATADLLIAMIAPTTPGNHSGQWRLRETKTGLFGATIGVGINVLGSTQPQGSQPPAPGCAGAPVIASFDANPAAITA